VGIFGQTTFPAIPAAYLATFQGIKQTSGIPISWLAAVCQETLFNPSFVVSNPAVATTRQVGLAGLWMDVPDARFVGLSSCHGNTVNAGWDPAIVLSNGTQFCCICQTLSNLNNALLGGGLLDPTTNLGYAQQMLTTAKTTIESMFGTGALNALVFYVYALGPNYVPEKDPAGLPIIPQVGSALAATIWSYVEAQAYYAPQFAETPSISDPQSTPPCPIGYTFNSATQLCCTPQNQCIPAIACPAGTSFDPILDACTALPCSATNPCSGGLVCVNGACVPPPNCSVNNPCLAPLVCENGVCVGSCTPPNVPINGVCQPPGGCVTVNDCPACGVDEVQTCNGGVCGCSPVGAASGSIWPWLVVGGLSIGWLGAAALHEQAIR
jgi:hypothetical protein